MPDSTITVDQLSDALSDTNVNVRQAAKNSLKAIGTPEALKATEEYQQKVDEHQRQIKQEAEAEQQAKTLIERNEWKEVIKLGTVAVESLILALKDSEPSKKLEAVRALGEIGDERAVEPLISTLKDNSKDPQLDVIDMHETAAEALGKIGDKRAVEPLISVLKDSPDYGRKQQRH